MRITLISPCAQIHAAFGMRTLSSYLREKGHQTRLIFLPDFNDYSENLVASPGVIAMRRSVTSSPCAQIRI